MMRNSIVKNVALLSVVLLSTAVLTGCSGKPKGFPSVKPCVITVTDGTNPVEGVEVALIPAQVMSGTIIGGKTDAQGVCAVRTTFAGHSAAGAPTGEFTVTLKKTPEVPDMPELTPEKAESMERSEIDQYYKERDAKIAALPKIVPPDLTSFQTSPIKANIPSDAELTVDLSKY